MNAQTVKICFDPRGSLRDEVCRRCGAPLVFVAGATLSPRGPVGNAGQCKHRIARSKFRTGRLLTK
jgi:hypothetical protein